MGAIHLEVTASCCSPWRGRDLSFDQVRTLHELRIRRLGGISGRCVSEEDPDIGLGAEVCVITEMAEVGDETRRCVATDAHGSFLIESLHEGSYTVEVEAGARPKMALRGVEVWAGELTALDDEVRVPPGA